MNLNTRNATLADLAAMLQDQQARKVDMIVPASKITADLGDLVVAGADAIITDDGVTTTDGRYTPTKVCDEGIASKFDIPGRYLARLRDTRIDLYDDNVNGWLHGTGPTGAHADPAQFSAPGDDRSFLLRTFRGDDGAPGVARAFLSDRYGIFDNLDVLTAALDGVRQAGANVTIDGCDLTDRRMYVRIVAPEVQALAPTLLAGYRSPFSGASGADNPTMFAGFVLSNSEVGNGAFSITPRLVVQVCNNGLTLTKDAIRSVHVGSKMDEGVIRWSDETHKANLDLVARKTADAVATFLDVDYMTKVIERLSEDAQRRLTDPAKAIEHVGKTLRYSQDHIAGVLDHFIRGGQVTAGGVLQAVTSFAQTISDADVAAEMEDSAMEAFAAAVRVAV